MPAYAPRHVLAKSAGCMVVVGAKESLDLYVREDAWNMKRYPAHFPAELKLATWDDGQVMPAVVMLRLNQNDLTTFDTWINPGDPAGVRMLQSIGVNPTAVIHFVTDSIVRSMRVNNTMREKAEKLVQEIMLRGASWSPADFTTARERINKLYPTSSALWWAKPSNSAPARPVGAGRGA